MTTLANHPATSDISAIIPSGTIGIWPVSTSPSGWLLCAGQELNRTGTYANLFAAIASAYGAGNGTTTFNIPDLRGSVAVGAHQMAGSEPNPPRLTENKDKGQGAGQRSLSLSLSEMPTHQHGVTGGMNRNNPHAHNWVHIVYYIYVTPNTGFGLYILDYASSSYFSYNPTNNVNNNHNHNVASVGGSVSHNNMQPYIALNQIIKI